MTEPIREIIPRDVSAEVQEILDSFSDFLGEFVNFGSHIMSWDDHPKTKGEENIAPSMLFRHFLDLVDGISILVRTGSGDTAKLLVRGALEVMLQLEYLFKEDTYERSIAFLVVEILNEIKMLKKFDSSTQEGKDLEKIFADEKQGRPSQFHSELDLKEAIHNKMKLFDLPQFQKPYAESRRLKAANETKPNWYRYYGGPKNIQNLARHLKMETFYELLYRKWSGSTHGTDVYLGKVTHNDSGGVDIVQLRYIKSVQEVVKFSLSFCIKVFSTFIRNRLPERMEGYGFWYMSIRDRYIEINTREFFKVE